MAKQKNSDLMVRIIKDSAVWQYLPDPNTIITDFGSNLLIYDKMKLDSRIGSLFDDRRNATHNLGISITTPEDESVAEYAAKYLTEANLRKWGFFLLDGALTYGFRPAEVVWKEDQEYCGSAVANVISQIRRKIGNGYIETVINSGYKFVG